VWFLRVHPPGQSLRIPGRGSRARRERGALLGVGLGAGGPAPGRRLRLRVAVGGGGAEACAELGLALPHALALARDLRGRGGLWTVAAPPRLGERESGRERAPPPPTLHTRRHAPLWARAVRAARPPLPLSAARDAGVYVRCAYKAPRNGLPRFHMI
jgi:hypothetical protein